MAERTASGPGYDAAYFERRLNEGRRSASVVVPIVHRALRPSSVVDVGCGAGAWLEKFVELGVADITGIDGPWVDTRHLAIPQDRFVRSDLTGPIPVSRAFDLAVCLEVAEHLPPEGAERLIEGLCRLAPAVLFSAAIPMQGGTGHINEQWPDYWARIFDRHGYVAVDCIRPVIWDSGIEFWYAQNTILYVTPERLETLPALEPFRTARPLALVHPLLYERTLAARPKPTPWRRIRGRLGRVKRRILRG